MTDARVSREHVEALIQVAPTSRVSRVHVESLISTNPTTRLSRQHVEVLYDPNLQSRLTGSVGAITGTFDLQASTTTTMALSGIVSAPTAAFNLSNPLTVSLAGAVPGVESSIIGTHIDHVTVAGEGPRVTGSVSLTRYDSEINDAFRALGPVAYWRLGERPNINGEDWADVDVAMLDSSGNGHHGLIPFNDHWFSTNGPISTTPSYYPYDDGDNSVILGGEMVVEHDTWMDALLDEFTFIGWVQVPNLYPDYSQSFAGRVSASGDSGGIPNDDASEVFGFVNKTGIDTLYGLHSRVRNAANQVVQHYIGTLDTPTYGWKLLAITYDGTNVRTYKGPTLMGTTALSPPLKTSTRDLVLRGGGSTTKMQFDEFALYDYALSADDIEDLWSIGSRVHISLENGYPYTTAAQVPRLASNIQVRVAPMVQVAGNVGAVTGSFTLSKVEQIALAGAVRGVESTISMDVARLVTLSSTVPPVTSFLVVDNPVGLTMSGVLSPVTGTFSITTVRTVMLDSSPPAVTGAFTVAVEGVASVDGTVRPLTGSLALIDVITGVLAGTVRPLTGLMGTETSVDVTLDGSVPGVTSTIALGFAVDTSLAGVVPGVTSAIYLGFADPAELAGIVAPLTGSLAVMPVVTGVLSGSITPLEGRLLAGNYTEVVRWTFTDTDTDERASLLLNPNKMSTPTFARETQFAWTPGRGMAGVDRMQGSPTSWTFEGVILTKVHYDLLLEWAGRGVILRVDDHLGRAFGIIIEKYDPIERLPTVSKPWRADYTMTCLLLEVIET